MNKNYSNNEIPSAEVISWLEKGVSIHKSNNYKKCRFCGGFIEICEIEKTINNYLLDKKQVDLIFLDKINKRLENILNIKSKIDENRILMNNLIGNEINIYYDDIEDSIINLNLIINKINAKLTNFENEKSFDSTDLKNIMNKIEDDIAKLTELKNKKEAELFNTISKINILVKGSIAMDVLENDYISDLTTEHNNIDKEISSASTMNEELSKQIDELKKSKSATNDFATFINDLLEGLGVDFYLDVVDYNYTIKHKRDNISLKIEDISEGECNLLALLFFYYELFNDKFQTNYKNEITYIIIDDPISSMDDVNKSYVLELIKKIISLNTPQIFVFTHVWEDFCNLCYGKKDSNETDYRFYEIKKNNDTSYIIKAKTSETPYMHDFKEIFDFSKKENVNDLDECETYHYPNVMRKVLENFMRFKVKKSSPTLNNISNVKIALCKFDNCSPSDDIQLLALLDVCNILSHKTIRNPEQILKSAKYLMKTIKEADSAHFNTMTN